MATITKLQSTDNGADSLSIINTNLENLNTDKLESSDLSGYELLSNKETSALDTSTTKYPCNNVVKSAVDAKMSNPMFASGDIIYGGASGVATRLPKGDDDKVLMLKSGLPSWETPASGGADIIEVQMFS